MDRISSANYPAADLFGSGKHGFQAGDASTSTPASIPGPAWFNNVQEEIAGVIESVGDALDASSRTQLYQAFCKIVRRGMGMAVASTGTAPAYVITPSPAVGSLNSLVGFRVAFHAANAGAASTLNVSGLGAKSLKQYSSTGAKVDAIVVAGHVGMVVYDGTDMVLLNPLPLAVSGGVRGARSNLKISYTGTSGLVTVTADELVLENSSGGFIKLDAVSLTATSGSIAGAVNGLDAGSWAFSTIYHLFAVYNPTTATKGLLWSLSPTAPMLPSGYTYWARIGQNVTQSATSYWFLGGEQRGNEFKFLPNASGNVTGFPRLSSGSQGSASTPTYVTISLAAYIGSTISSVCLRLGIGSANTQAALHPVSGGGAYGSLTNPPEMMITAASVTQLLSEVAWMRISGTSVYYFNGDATYGALHLIGWKDEI